MKKFWAALFCLLALSLGSVVHADVPDPSGRPRPRPRPYPVMEEPAPGIHILRSSLYLSYQGLEENEVLLKLVYSRNKRTTFEFVVKNEDGQELEFGRVPSGGGYESAEIDLKLPKPAEGTTAIYSFSYTSWEDKIRTNFGLKNTDQRLEETRGGFKFQLRKNDSGYDLRILPL